MITSLGIRSAVIGVAIAAVAVSVTTLTSGSTALAATILVDTTNDPGTPTSCSLRAAIAAANTNAVVDGCVAGAAGLDEIRLLVGVPATVTLTSGPIAVVAGEPLSIVGTSSASTIIDGNNGDGIFNAAADVSFTDVTLRNATSTGNGGAVLSTASVSLLRSRITGVSVPACGAFFGAGVYASGNVTITNSQIDNATGCSAAAIAAFGNLAIAGSTISDNTSESTGSGVVYGDQAITVTNSTFARNGAGFGGAILGNNTVSVTGSIFTSNTSTNGGAAIAANGTIGVTNSILSSNTAPRAGALLSYNANVTVNGSTLRSNTALAAAPNGYGGAISAATQVSVVTSLFDANLAREYGGAIYAPVIDVSRSTFQANQADFGAALSAPRFNPGDGLSVVSSTFDGNVTPAAGGAIYTDSDTASIRLSMFAANRAPVASALAAADVFVDLPGFIELGGNIFGATASGPSCGGPGDTITAGSNVAEEASNSCDLAGPGDVLATSAQLGPLQVNAPGATPTRSISPLSPALDLVLPAFCTPVTTIDQRGVVRGDPAAGTGTRCDAGAYELSRFLGSVTVGFTSSNTSLNGQDVEFSMACPGVFGSPFTGSAAVNGANVTFTGIDAGAVCTVTPTYPSGMDGPATFSAPVALVNDTVVVFGDVIVVVIPPTTPGTTAPGGTVPGGGGAVVIPGSTVPGGAAAPTTTVLGQGAIPATGSNVDGLVAFACAMLFFGIALMVLRKPNDPVAVGRR